MPLAALRPASRVVVQTFLRDTIQLCACELVDRHGASLVLRPLDDLPAGIGGQPVTLLAPGDNCLVRMSGQVMEATDTRLRVAVETDEVEQVQRRRFARLTGWLPVRVAQGELEGAATLVDASQGGAAVLTNLDINGGDVTITAEGRTAVAGVVHVNRLDSGVRRLHLSYREDADTEAAASAVMAVLDA